MCIQIYFNLCRSKNIDNPLPTGRYYTAPANEQGPANSNSEFAAQIGQTGPTELFVSVSVRPGLGLLARAAAALSH